MVNGLAFEHALLRTILFDTSIELLPHHLHKIIPFRDLHRK